MREQFIAERTKAHKAKCSCGGTGLADHKAFGDATVKVQCPKCSDFQNRLDLFCRGFFNPKYVLPRYWGAVNFSEIKPMADAAVCPLPVPNQRYIIDKVQAAPNRGYAIFGPPQAGKTHLTVGLYARVLWHELMTADMTPTYRVPVRRLTSKALLDQLQTWQFHGDFDEVAEPDVTRDKIIRCYENGSTYRLFLEEVDKVKETEARRANLFEIMDTLHGCMGQFVMTSNLTPEAFAEVVGGDFFHRVKASAEIIDLF